MKAKLIILVSCLLWLVAFSSQAAEIFFKADKQPIVGELFEAELRLDAHGQSLNALEGKISFSDNLELKNINDGNSIIALWIQKPKTSGNTVSFSGIIPGGYQGVLGPDWQGYQPGTVLKLVFLVDRVGQVKINLEDFEVLLNDGKGTEAPLLISPLALTAQEGVSAQPLTLTEDKNLPEEFTPQIAGDPNTFDGKWFLIFSSRDNETGINRYEVLEKYAPGDFRALISKKPVYGTAESPYVLKDQKLKSFIYVKAIDKTGNERIAVVEPRYPIKWYEQPLIWSIIMLLLVVLYIIGKILWKIIH